MNVSDLWPLSAKELGAITDGTIYRLLTGLEAFLYRNSTVCTCQSQEIVDYISARKKQNVWLLRNGVDTARFADEVGTERSNKIVYAGLLGIAQGILSIIENVNFRELGMEFHIFGSGNEKEEIEKFLAVHPDRGVVYRGVLGRDDIPHTLARYDATLVALVKNIYGAVPSKIYEAMAAGLPILFSGVGEGARIVRENAVGWQNDPGDWKSLIHNLIRLKQTSNEELLEMKRKARRVASDKFDRRNQITNFHLQLSGLTT
jgi:glycosyltransferase involved in cell wall biosynthesis